MAERSNVHDTVRRVRSSALWAAWADALGFISELTDEAGVRRRTRGRELTDVMPWKRRIGGQYGVSVELPAGTYSDDTQLRIATARAISNHGFDVEAFARVELSVWPSYALGGGRASKAAAAAMTKSHALWVTNFYNGWTNGGGNGAAMRIQPHVWSASNLEQRSYSADVVRNSITSHGHPRGILGATLSAAALGHVMRTGRSPLIDDWSDLLEEAVSALTFIENDAEVSALWLPNWPRVAKEDFEVVWNRTAQEVEELFHRAGNAMAGATRLEAYEGVAQALSLRDDSVKGSGTTTVVAALVLAHLFPDDARAASIASANAVGTDTDTIGTMAAAVIGAADAQVELPSEVQDRDYLWNEGERLARVAHDLATPKFSYPDLLRWQPPASQLDAVGVIGGREVLSGLGWLRWKSAPERTNDAVWQWADSSAGPSVLVKHRAELRPLPGSNAPLDARVLRQNEPKPPKRELPPLLFEDELTEPTKPSVKSKALDLNEVLAELDSEPLSNATVGRAIGRVVSGGTRRQMAEIADAIWTRFKRN